MTTDTSASISDYWGREGLGAAILDALSAAGKNLDALTIDDLAPTDQFHGGGKDATLRLARLAALEPGLHVLDVGGGVGGPARTLAVEFGCRVTTIDLTESFVRAAAMLTELLGLEAQVTHQVGDALALPFDDGAFDVVWTQNTGMNIADKARLYLGPRRVRFTRRTPGAVGRHGGSESAASLPRTLGRPCRTKPPGHARGAPRAAHACQVRRGRLERPQGAVQAVHARAHECTAATARPARLRPRLRVESRQPTTHSARS